MCRTRSEPSPTNRPAALVKRQARNLGVYGKGVTLQYMITWTDWHGIQ